MVNRAYVGNLPFQFTSADLEQLFGPYGAVKGAEIVMDRETGRSRGFGFVEMESPEALRAAMAALDGKPIGGRNLTVNEARERAPRAPGGDRPFGGGGDRGGFAPRASSGPPRSASAGGAPRPGWSDRPSGGGGGGSDRGGPPRGRSDKDRGDRLARPEKGRDDHWRYKKGGEDED